MGNHPILIPILESWVMKVAIAGASGNLGVRLCAHLRAHKIPHVALVRSAESARRLPAKTPHRIVDYTAPASLRSALAGCTHLVNLTGSIDTTRTPAQLLEANVDATARLLDAAPPSIKRAVHISSIAALGPYPGQKADESFLPRPRTAYGKTKLMGEQKALSHSSRFKVVVLRPGMVYGPGFHAGFHPLLKRLEDRSLRLIGPGRNRLPLVHVDEVCDAIRKALTAPVKSGSVYFIVSTPVTQCQAISLAAHALDAPLPHASIDPALARLAAGLVSALKRLQGKKPSLTPDMVDQLSADRRFSTERARHDLSWRPSVPLLRGIEQVIAEYRSGKGA